MQSLRYALLLLSLAWTQCQGADNSNVPGCLNLVVTVMTDNYPSEMSWSISEAVPFVGRASGNYTLPNTIHTDRICLTSGQYTLNLADTYGDGWGSTGYIQVHTSSGMELANVAGNSFSYDTSASLQVPTSTTPTTTSSPTPTLTVIPTTTPEPRTKTATLTPIPTQTPTPTNTNTENCYRPGNDECTGAVTLSASVTESLLCAKQSDQTVDSCQNVEAGTSDVWYVMELTQHSSVDLSTCGSGAAETRLTVLWGDCVNGFTCVAAGNGGCSDGSVGHTHLATNLAKGTYYVVVHGPPSAGTFSLSFSSTSYSADGIDEECISQEGWRDMNNYTCTDYSDFGWCGLWAYGPAWNRSWGAFYVYADANGVAADEACCDCGIAWKKSTPQACQLGQWSEWNPCEPDGTGITCEHFRRRPILTYPTDGVACQNMTYSEACTGCSQCPMTPWMDWGCFGPALNLRYRSINALQADATEAQPTCPSFGTGEYNLACSGTEPEKLLLQTAGDNAYGQLGQAFETEAKLASLSNVGSPDGLAVSEVRSGRYHSGLLAQGLAYMCGLNDNGQLGLGDDETRGTFTLVAPPNNTRVSALALGYSHSALITETGSLYTFGLNEFGALGLGTQGNTYYRPVRVEDVYLADGTLAKAPAFSAASLGRDHSAFLTDSTQLYTAGRDNGLLCVDGTGNQPVPRQAKSFGSGSVLSVSISEAYTVAVDSVNTAYYCSDNSWVELDTGVAKVAAGFDHLLLLMTDGTVKAMGSNARGQLGLGSATASADTPTAVPLPSGSLATDITAGYQFSAIATTTGGVVTFGSGTSGALGTDSTEDEYVPTEISAGSFNGPVHQVSAGYYHLALVRDYTKTPTPTMTNSRTPTPSRTPTGTATVTSRVTRTLSSTDSPSPTSPLTLTPSSPACASVTSSLAAASWTLQASTLCVQEAVVGASTNSWMRHQLRLAIVSLPAPLAISFLAGCNGTAEASGCTYLFTSADEGQTVYLDIDVPADSSIRLTFGSTLQSVARATSTASDVEVGVVSEGTVLLLCLLCLLAAVVAAVLVALWQCGVARWNNRPKRKEKSWKLNLRLAKRRSTAAISVGVWMILTGVGWLLIVAFTSTEFEPKELVYISIVFLALGVVLALGAALWSLRDPTSYECEACNTMVSRWIFMGTYYPDPHDPTVCKKAHSKHRMCVICSKKVVENAWPHAPPTRPYHDSCFGGHCAAALTSPDFVTRWAAGQPEGAVTDVELAHLLTAQVRAGYLDGIKVLLDSHKHLPSVPVAGEGDRCALHVAASLGYLAVLEELLSTGPATLDPACPISSIQPRSVSIKGMEDPTDDDVYIHQPGITLNARAVYVGHERGKYLFFYQPDKGDAEGAITPGWCLYSHLGSGSSPWRLPLPDPLEGFIVAPADAKGGRLARVSQRLRRKHEDEVQSPMNMMKTADPPPTPIDQVLQMTLKPADTPKKRRRKEKLDFEAPEGDAEMAAPQPPPNVQVVWVPHSRSVLEEAIQSGDLPTIKRVAELYREQDPGCLLWKHHSGHGLWDVYSAPHQTAIRDALRKGATTVSLYPPSPEAEGEAGPRGPPEADPDAPPPVVVDFQARQHLHNGKPEGIKSEMRDVFQFRPAPDEPFKVTSDPNGIQNWSKAIVVYSPSHGAVSATNEATLSFLVTEGLVDYTLWSPPTKVGSPGVVFASQQLESMLRTVTQQVAQRVLDVHRALIMDLGVGGRRGSRRTPEVGNGRGADQAGAGRGAASGHSETGIGSRLTDGLDSTQGHSAVAFYAPGYTSSLGCLPFCKTLPENEMGMKFSIPPIISMGLEALMKVSQMQRQRYVYEASHVVAVYVYSYELDYEEDGFDQIYAQMNKAMRLRIAPLIEYWRPLIWEVSNALEHLPSFKGLCYRGINCQLNPDDYQTSSLICWPSFSSASQSQDVAKKFAEGEAGTLFFLTSNTAKPISAISRFPEEAEVLFPPNSVFTISSTLFGDSDIGAFYGRIDNVAMAETAGEVSTLSPHLGLKSSLDGKMSFLLHVPDALADKIIALLAGAGLTTLESAEAAQEGIARELLTVPDTFEDLEPQPIYVL